MKKIHMKGRWLLLITLILFGVTGCGLQALSGQDLSSEERLQTQIEQTMVALNVAETLAAQGQLPALDQAPSFTNTLPLAATATLTPSPTITLTSTITPTSTLEVPMVSVSTNTNCREGPGTTYDIVGALLVGEQAEVVGKGEYGNYWIIKNPDGSGECWLWSYYATVVGPTDGLAVRTPPPTPTPAFDWSGIWDVTTGMIGDGVSVIWTMNAWVSGKNFTATIDFGLGHHEDYTGTISDDYLSVSGNWTLQADSGTFTFYALGSNQFQGHETDGTNTYQTCGAKGGAGLPSPCYRP